MMGKFKKYHFIESLFSIVLFCVCSQAVFANDTLKIQYTDTIYSTGVNPFLKTRPELPFYFYPIDENIKDSLIYVLNDSLDNGTYIVMKDDKIKQVVTYQNQEKASFESFYWDNGNLKEKINWDLRNSPNYSKFFESYYENGSLRLFSTDTLKQFFQENGDKFRYSLIKKYPIKDTARVCYIDSIHDHLLHSFFLNETDSLEVATIKTIVIDTSWHQNGLINTANKNASYHEYFYIKRYDYKTRFSISHERNTERWYPTGIKAVEMSNSSNSSFFNVTNSWDTLGNSMVINGTGHHEEWIYIPSDSTYYKYWEMTYKNGQKHGTVTFYSMSLNGLNINRSSNYKNDLLHGVTFNYQAIMEDNQILDFIKSEKVKYKNGEVKKSKALIKNE